MLKKPDYQHIFVGKEKVGFAKSYQTEWDEDLGEDAAQLILNIDIRSTAVPGQEIGDALFDAFKNNFFQDLEKDPYYRFEESLKMMNDIIVEKESEYGVKFLANISVIAAVITKGTLFLSQHGDAEAYLVRQRHVSVVSDGLHDSNSAIKELFANVASGGVAPGDRLVYSTARLYRYVTKMDLAKFFSDYEIKEALTELNNAVSMDVTERVSVCSVKINEQAESRVVADLGPESKPVKKPGLYSKFSHKFADNGLVNFFTEKSEDLSHFLNKSSDKSGVVNEWKRLGRDKVLMSLILVVVILIGGIYLVRNQGQKQQYIEDLEMKLAEASEKVSEAETKGSYDKDQAAGLLDDAEELAMEVLASGYLRSSASQHLDSIQEQRDYLDNVIRVEEPVLLADLSDKRSTVSALGLVPYEGSVYAYEYNGLYEVELSEVKDPVTIDDEEIVVSGSYFEDQDNILFLTETGDIIEYDGLVFNFMDTTAGSFYAGVQAEPYSSRVYILDPGREQIWKYYRQRDSYGSAEGYITDGSDISEAVSMAIDGAIWVLNSDGTISKFISGLSVDFDVERAPLTDYSGATKIYTSFESNQLYLLDASNDRVMVFNKDVNDGDLVYSTQYVFEGLSGLRDIYISQEENRIYLLTETEVYYYSL